MKKIPTLLLIFVIVALGLSSINAHDFLTWILEVFPVIVGICILIPTTHKFRFTNLVYGLMAMHAIILIIGGHYTYAEVPAFNWLRDQLGLMRNPYDRVGHFFQGFVPALIAREILIRQSVIKNAKWLFFLIVCICLALSATYELIEWWASLLGGEAGNAFLSTQGDIWDTQWDMFLALIGALLSLCLLGHMHDRAIERRSPSIAPRLPITFHSHPDD